MLYIKIQYTYFSYLKENILKDGIAVKYITAYESMP